MPKSDIQIRRAIPADSAALTALERNSPTAAHWPEAFYAGLFENALADRLALVAEEAGGIQGFLVARILNDECELENIVVANGAQRRGLGASLIRRLIQAGRTREVKRILLEVRESNVSARCFYEKCGLSIAGRRKLYYTGPIEDAIIYTLTV